MLLPRSRTSAARHSAPLMSLRHRTVVPARRLAHGAASPQLPCREMWCGQSKAVRRRHFFAALGAAKKGITKQTLPGRLKLPTLRLTASRSNQLSYGSSCAGASRASRLCQVAMCVSWIRIPPASACRKHPIAMAHTRANERKVSVPTSKGVPGRGPQREAGVWRDGRAGVCAPCMADAAASR